METVGDRIRYVRTSKEMSLEDLAEKSGLSKSFLWEVERGRSGISGERLLRLANVLGASLDYLLRGQPSPVDYQPPVIEVPGELSELAEDEGLTHRQTLALLEVHRSILARRSSKRRERLSKEEWRKLYEGVKEFLEGHT